MNTKAIAALSLSVSGVAFAQNDKDVRADRAGQVERGERPAVDRSQSRPATRDQRTWDRVNGGGRLPPQWRSNQYVVDDWRGHRLSSPPRGYHWVQTGGDCVLVAIATGIIASILLSQ